MAVSKLIIIFVLIGFLSGLVSNHPVKRRSANAQYLLPKTLEEKDGFVIKFHYTDVFVIQLIADENEIAYTFTVELDDNNPEEKKLSDNELIVKTSSSKFVENSTVTVNFTVRKSGKTGLTNIISIGGLGEEIKKVEIEDADISDIKCLTVTGKNKEDVQLSELKFKFGKIK